MTQLPEYYQLSGHDCLLSHLHHLMKSVVFILIKCIESFLTYQVPVRTVSQLKYFIAVKIMSSLLLSRNAADKNSKCAIACVLERFFLVSNFYI
jgi:hypothetical protein